MTPALPLALVVCQGTLRDHNGVTQIVGRFNDVHPPEYRTSSSP